MPKDVISNRMLQPSTATVAVAWRLMLGRDLGPFAADLFAWDVGQIQAAYCGATESALRLTEMLLVLVAACYVLQSLQVNQPHL